MSEDEMTAQIAAWGQHHDSQPHEVAAKFMCEARSLLRDGKDSLAERKAKAAFRVGGVESRDYVGRSRGMIKRDRSKVTHDDGIDYCDLCNYCIDGLDICSNTCAFVVVRHQALQKREKLVQEVIRLGEREMFVDKDGSIGEYQDALNELRDAIVALAEWKP